MKKSQVMITRMHMCRNFLITKEKMKDMCKGQGMLKESVNDDIEALFADLQLGRNPKARSCTYFLPKLTHVEKDLVEKKDPNYLKTFSSYEPTINDDEMRSSESKSMYVRGWCTRDTTIVKNPMFQDQDVSNVPSDQIVVEINSSVSSLNDDDIEEKLQYQQKCYYFCFECCRLPLLFIIAIYNTFVELLENIVVPRPS